MPRKGKVTRCPRCYTTKPHTPDSRCARDAAGWGEATARLAPDRAAMAEKATGFMATLEGLPKWVAEDLGGHYTRASAGVRSSGGDTTGR